MALSREKAKKPAKGKLLKSSKPVEKASKNVKKSAPVAKQTSSTGAQSREMNIWSC